MAANAPADNPSTSATDASSVVSKVLALAKDLQARGAKDGARRLEVLAQQYQQFTVEGASQYIRKDDILDELEGRGHWITSILHGTRNLLSITPIAFTWWALHLAADAYERDVHDYSNDRYQPFLLLWQQGFRGNHGFVFSFSFAAFLDAFLLSFLVLLVVFLIPIWEKRYSEGIRMSLEGFDATIDDLLMLIGKDGANAHLADSDVSKISNAIGAVLQKVLLNYDRVAGEARKFVENTNQSTQNLIKNFEDNLAVFNSDVKLLTNDLQKLDTNLGSYGQKLTELTNASNKLAGSSNDLALNAKSMADSATLSSQASQGISTQLGALNTAQQEIVKTQQGVATTIAQSQQQVVTTISQTQGDVVKQFSATQQNVVQEIERAQKDVVKEITNVADSMDESSKNTLDVAMELENVVKSLKQMTQADLQILTNQVASAANQVDRVAASLGQVDAQLQVTTKALADAAKTMSMATKRWWQFWKRP